GVWWSFAAGLAITMAWSAALWLLRRARLRLGWCAALLGDGQLVHADHFRPFVPRRLNETGEAFRRASPPSEHLSRATFFAVQRTGQDLRRLGVDLVDDRARRAGGREQPEAGRGLVARQPAFGDGRGIGGGSKPLAAADAENLDLAGAERRQR